MQVISREQNLPDMRLCPSLSDDPGHVWWLLQRPDVCQCVARLQLTAMMQLGCEDAQQ